MNGTGSGPRPGQSTVMFEAAPENPPVEVITVYVPELGATVRKFGTILPAVSVVRPPTETKSFPAAGLVVMSYLICPVPDKVRLFWNTIVPPTEVRDAGFGLVPVAPATVSAGERTPSS